MIKTNNISVNLFQFQAMTDRVVLKEFEVLNCSTEPNFFGGHEKVASLPYQLGSCDPDLHGWRHENSPKSKKH